MATVKGRIDGDAERERGMMWMLRWVGWAAMKPHVKRMPEPEKLIEFAWEKSLRKKTQRKPMTNEEARAVAKRLEGRKSKPSNLI